MMEDLAVMACGSERFYDSRLEGLSITDALLYVIVGTGHALSFSAQQTDRQLLGHINRSLYQV
jgi:hypothetical protein